MQSMMAGVASEQMTNTFEGSVSSKLILCRIYDVDAEARTCSIKTFGTDEEWANADYVDVQWLSLYSSPEGDEICYVPRIGSLGVAGFVAGQPYIIGYFNPLVIDEDEDIQDLEGEGVKLAGGSAATNKEKINPGDVLFRTIGKCRLALRAGGEIELESTKICRRTYFPARNRISEISQNLEIDTDGGYIHWTHNDQENQSDETVCRTKWRDDISGTNVIEDEKGTVELGSELIHRFQIRPGSNVNESLAAVSKPVFIRETYNTGKTEFKINETAYHELILPDGTYKRGIGEDKNLTEIKPTGEMHVNINQKYDRVTLDTGETTVNIADKWKLNIKPEGDTTLDVAGKFKAEVKASGETTIDIGPGKTKMVLKPSGDMEVECTGQVKMKAAMEVFIEGKMIYLNAKASNPMLAATSFGAHLGVVDLITNVPITPTKTVYLDL